MMQYKGYTGKVEFDDEAEIFHGEVIGLRDVITCQTTSRLTSRSLGNHAIAHTGDFRPRYFRMLRFKFSEI